MIFQTMHFFSEGYCKYHNGSIKYGFNCKLSCCNKTAKSVESVLLLPGCVKGKHRSEHHTEFPYTMYSIFMLNLVCIGYSGLHISD